MRKLFLILIIVLTFGNRSVKSQGFTYNVTYANYPAQAQIAFDYACELWSYILYSPIQIKINTVYYTFAGGPLGTTFSNGRKDFVGAAMDSTWYPTSLGNFLANTELNPGEYDMDIYMNGAFNWYFGIDGNVQPGQYDFASVIMHEIGHALGFTSLAKKVGSTGSLGMLLQSDFAPVNPSFPWPDQDTMPGIYDRFIENNLGAQIDTFLNPSTALGTQFTSNQLYFNGPLAVAINSGIRPRLHAPGVFELGTSILHLNESTYPNGHADELMTPYITAGYAHHLPGPITIAMLQDMGWTLHTGINENLKSNSGYKVFPIPANNYLNITANNKIPEKIDIRIYNAAGLLVLSKNHVDNIYSIDVQNLDAGLYILEINGLSDKSQYRFIKM